MMIDFSIDRRGVPLESSGIRFSSTRFIFMPRGRSSLTGFTVAVFHGPQILNNIKLLDHHGDLK